MISYVCKITVMGSKPPVWWRCHIPAGISFSSLSILLDRLIGLEEDGDFSFEIRRTARVWEPTEQHQLGPAWHESAYDAAHTAVDLLFNLGKAVNYLRGNKVYQIKVESVEDSYPFNYPLVLKVRCDTDAYALMKRIQDGIRLEDKELKRPRNKAQMLAQAKNGVVRLPRVSRELVQNELYYKPSSAALIREIANQLYSLHNDLEKLRQDQDAELNQEPSEQYTLQEILRFYDREDLEEFGEKYGIPIRRKDSNEDIVNRLAEKMLNPDNLNHTFLSLTDDETAAFDLIVQAGGMLKLTGKLMEKEKHFYTLENTAYVFHTDRDILFAGTDVIEAYLKISTPEFHERRRKVSYLLRCLQMIVPYYYVILPVRKFARIARRKKDPVISAEEIPDLLPQVADTLHDCVIRDEMICTGQVIRDPQAMEAVRNMQKDKPYYIMTEDEIDEILRDGYPRSNRRYREFQEFLQKEMKTSEETAEKAAREAHRLIALSSHMQKFFDMLKTLGVIPTEAQAEKLMELYAPLVANTHTMYNRGYTPNDLRRIRGDEEPFRQIRMDNARIEVLPDHKNDR